MPAVAITALVAASVLVCAARLWLARRARMLR